MKLLFISKETYAWPLHYLIEKLPRVYDCHVVTPLAHESILNTFDYKNFIKLNSQLKHHNYNKFAYSYHNSKNKIDYNYLEYIEKNFTSMKNLNLQIISSQFFSSNYHYRKYYYEINMHQRINFLTEFYKYTEELIDNIKPDIIIDIDNSEFARHCFLEIALKKNIQHTSILPSQYLNYFIPREKLGLEIDKWIDDAFNNFLRRSTFKDNLENIEQFRNEKNVMPEVYRLYYEKSKFNFINDTIFLLRRIVYFTIHVSTNLKSYIFFKNSPFLSKPYSRFNSFFKEYFNKLMNTYFALWDDVDIKRENYVLVPLHTIPESSTFSDAPFYLDELEIIKAVSKSVPINQIVLVKEHFFMLQERPRQFYRELKKISNVKLVNPFKYSTPNEYITNSNGLIAINGTSIIEAAILGKPVASFVNSIWCKTKSIEYVSDIRKLPSIIKKFQNFRADYEGLETMINVIKLKGEKLDIGVFMKSKKHIKSEELLKNQNNLIKLFYKAVELK